MLKKLKKVIGRKRIERIEINHEDFDKSLYEFKSPSKHSHERGLFWLIGIVLFFIFMLFYAINQGSASMSVAVIILAAVYYLANQEPAYNIGVKVSAVGIKIGKKIIPFGDIRGFWINYLPPLSNQIHFYLSQGSPREIIILLSDADREYLKHVLSHYIPELEGKRESLIDLFGRLFKL